MERPIQEALTRVDQIVSNANLPRQVHAQLAQDLQLIQQQLIRGLEAQKELEYLNKSEEKK
jgi:transcription initiation factor TFIIIB Brf1 subunit/transcription initiation factor TFIIB